MSELEVDDHVLVHVKDRVFRVFDEDDDEQDMLGAYAKDTVVGRFTFPGKQACLGFKPLASTKVKELKGVTLDLSEEHLRTCDPAVVNRYC